MAALISHSPAPSGGTPALAVGPPADVIELIMADHRRIRRLARALDDAARRDGDLGSGWVPALWQRLAGLLEAHARAEEEICYLPLFGSGPHAAGRRRDALDDHDDIRAAISETRLHPAGSAPWWRAVRAALAAAAGHLDREERDILAGAGLTASQRRELGRQWSAFTAAWRQDETLRPAGKPPYADAAGR